MGREALAYGEAIAAVGDAGAAVGTFSNDGRGLRSEAVGGRCGARASLRRAFLPHLVESRLRRGVGADLRPPLEGSRA